MEGVSTCFGERMMAAFRELILNERSPDRLAEELGICVIVAVSASDPVLQALREYDASMIN